MIALKYGTSTIHYSLKRSERKTLGIEVHPDLSVWAIAPAQASLEDINEKVLKRAAWILKQQSFFEQFLPRTPQRMYVAGETHLYLGRRYLLKTSKAEEKTVKLKAGCLHVQTPKNTKISTKNALTQWYYKHAVKVFNEVLKEQFTLFAAYNIEFPNLEIRRMKNRWGSCQAKGTIIINPEIIKAPKMCIRYVITHELCHLITPNHTKAFYNLQESILPNAQKWKSRLEEVMA